MPGRRTLCLMGLALLLFGFWLAFPQPDRSLWPPRERDDRHLVYVCIDGYHSLLTFPDYQLGFFQEWHMGVASWYLNRSFTTWEGICSLIRPVPATVRFGLFPLFYWERLNLPPETVYKFWLSAEGHRRLITYLHGRRGQMIKQAGKYCYFVSRQNWSPLTNCNGLIGGALQAAGLPIREIISLDGNTMHWQLSRSQSFQNEWQKNLLASDSAPASGAP